MNWDQYVLRFSERAKKQGQTESYVSSCLDYARKLFNEGFPIIYDIEHFSLLVGYNVELRDSSSI